jgi:hypothetical protein
MFDPPLSISRYAGCPILGTQNCSAGLLTGCPEGLRALGDFVCPELWVPHPSRVFVLAARVGYDNAHTRSTGDRILVTPLPRSQPWETNTLDQPSER